ncbi:MAG: hypothetical protein R3314_09440 [Longimicrobiales bacterium]|nr:hypothetical protein [Longimicrobiales bacterium]
MKRRFPTLAGPVLGILALATVVPLSTACEGFDFQWVPVVDTVAIFSLARPEFTDQPAAFDFYNRTRVVVERPLGGDPFVFDMALTELDGEMVLLPAGLFETFAINPGLAIDSSGTTFDELAEAPRDGYVTEEPVPVRTDVVYTVRTRRDGSGCSRYGKFEILEVHAVEGWILFRQVRNNLCNDRELIPPDDE